MIDSATTKIGSGTMMSYNGTRDVPREVLRTLPDPEPCGPRHYPVRYDVLVDGITESLDAIGYDIDAERICVGQTRTFGDLIVKNASMFGLMRLQRRGESIATENALPSTPVLGFHGSIAEIVNFRIVAGDWAFVCDNLSLSGEFKALTRKFTRGLHEHVAAAIDEGVRRWSDQYTTLEQRICKLQTIPIGHDLAGNTIARAVQRGALASKLLRPTLDTWDDSPRDAADVAHETASGDRSVFSLYSAATRQLRDLPTNRKLNASGKLSRFFGI